MAHHQEIVVSNSSLIFWNLLLDGACCSQVSGLGGKNNCHSTVGKLLSHSSAGPDDCSHCLAGVARCLVGPIANSDFGFHKLVNGGCS